MTRTAPVSLAFALCALAASASIASAQTVTLKGSAHYDPFTEIAVQPVPYTGADVADAAHARKLLEKIELAAQDVCGGDPGANSGYSARTEYADCTRAAVNQAVTDVRSPTLAAAAGRPAQTLASK